jgi:hypothetical protein
LKKQIFKETYPDLMKYWDYEKNNELGIYPDKITCGTRKKVYFINENGIRVLRSLKQINNKIKFFNSKLIINEYSKEKLVYFKQENNPEIDINQLSYGSRKEVLWTCPNNHNFIKSVRDFSKPTGVSCTICREKGIKQSHNKNIQSNLGKLSKNKNLLNEFSKNNKLKPEQLNLGNNRTKVLWNCLLCNNEYKASINQRYRKNTGCPLCNNKRTQSRNEIRIFCELSSLFKSVKENFIIEGYKYDIYIKDINLLIEYDGFYWHRKEKVKANDIKKNIIAKNNNTSLLRLREQGLKKTKIDDLILSVNTNTIRGNEAQFFIINQVLDYINLNHQIDFVKYKNNYLNKNYFINETLYNEKLSLGFVKNNLTKNRMFEQYDKEKTGINPKAISNNSRMKISWKCDKGKDHSWKETPANRNNPSSGCPFCSNKRISITNRLDKIHPISVDLWTDKNKNKPENYTYRNGKDKIIWNCSSCNNEFTKTIARMDDSKGYCPNCKTNHF